MKLKILTIGIMLLLTSNIFAVANNEITTDSDADSNSEAIPVNIALFADENQGLA